MPAGYQAVAVLVQFLWGFQYVVIKLGLQTVPPFLFLGIRFAVTAALLVPLAPRPSIRAMRRILPISLFLVSLHFGLFYCGIRASPGTAAAITYQLATPLVVLFSWMLLRETPSRLTLVGGLVSFAGVALLLAAGGVSAPVNVGVGMVAVAAACYAVGTVLAKKSGPFAPVALLGWTSLFAFPPLLAISALFEHGQLWVLRHPPMPVVLAFVYVVLIGGILGFGLWFWLIGRTSLPLLAPFGLLLPVFAVASSVVILHEPVTAALLAGGAMTLVGVALAQRGGRAQRPSLHGLDKAAPHT